jgi:apolipoprotein N-acyltransferase
MGLGLFWGTATALYRRFLPDGIKRVLVFAALFCLLEWLRGHLLTGFPWNPAGASWMAGSAMSQFAAIGGVYGLSLVTVAASAAFAPLLAAGSRKARIGSAVLATLVLGGLMIGGAVRLTQARPELTSTLVRIVQADVAQESKWTPEAYRGIVDRYVNLTARPGASVPDVIVWPEGALPASANDVFCRRRAGGHPHPAVAAAGPDPGRRVGPWRTPSRPARRGALFQQPDAGAKQRRPGPKGGGGL